MLMPTELRKFLSDDYKVYLDLALQGKKGPSAKDLRMMAFMKNLYGDCSKTYNNTYGKEPKDHTLV